MLGQAQPAAFKMGSGGKVWESNPSGTFIAPYRI